jgi:hypothetical protein
MMDERGIPSSLGAVFWQHFGMHFGVAVNSLYYHFTLWYLKEVEVASGCRQSRLSCLQDLHMRFIVGTSVSVSWWLCWEAKGLCIISFCVGLVCKSPNVWYRQMLLSAPPVSVFHTLFRQVHYIQLELMR